MHGSISKDPLVQVQKSIDNLKALEYDEIDLKVVFWMQGESDSKNPVESKKAFEYFVSDLRRDLGEIMGEAMSGLTIIVSEISSSSSAADVVTVSKNKIFISIQRKLAENISNVYTIAPGQYEITTLVNRACVNDSFQGATWPWNTEEMFNIGGLVIDCIIEKFSKIDKNSTALSGSLPHVLYKKFVKTIFSAFRYKITNTANTMRAI